jgi:hypothetical protein
MAGRDLRNEAVRWLHRGYHRQFIEFLPAKVFPQLATELLLKALEAAVVEGVRGHVQL